MEHVLSSQSVSGVTSTALGLGLGAVVVLLLSREVDWRLSLEEQALRAHDG